MTRTSSCLHAHANKLTLSPNCDAPLPPHFNAVRKAIRDDVYVERGQPREGNVGRATLVKNETRPLSDGCVPSIEIGGAGANRQISDAGQTVCLASAGQTVCLASVIGKCALRVHRVRGG